MIIVSNNIKRILKTKSLILLFFLPIIFTAFFLMGSMSPSQKIAVVNNDGYLSNWIIEGSAPEENITVLEADGDFENLVLTKKYDLIVVFPKNYEKDILENKNPQIEIYYSEGNPISILPNNSISTKASYAVQIASVSNSLEELKDLIMVFEESVFTKEEDILESNYDTGIIISSQGIGILLMSLMFVSNSAGFKMNDDKKTGMYQRIMASSISRRRYSLESILTLFVIITLKVVGVMTIITLMLGGNFGDNPINVLIALLLFGLVAVSITNLINAVSKDRKQAMTISILITTPLAMLGGCFWPIEITPKVMQYISNFVPTTWAMKAVSKMMSGLSLYDIRIEMLVLLLFSAAMFIISSQKKVVKVK